MSMSESLLAAAEQLMNEEFNGGDAEAPSQLEVELSGAPAEPDTPELTIDAQGRAHGPDGKFVAPAQEVEGGEETTSEPEVVQTDSADAEGDGLEANADSQEEVIELELDDPDILTYLEKYDGDVVKALKAATEAQKLIGRQGEELGTTRQENETLQAIVSQLQSLEARMTPYQSSLDEDPQGLLGEVLNRAAETGHLDEATYEAALSAWAEEEPFAAARLDAQVAMARQMAEQAVAQQPQPDQSAALAQEVEAFKQRHPDFQQLLPAINEMAAQRPLLQKALYEGSAQERVQALDDLYSLAKSRTVQSDTSAAAKRVILRAKAEADKAKADAAVVGASRTSAVKPDTPTGDRLLEQALRELSGLDDLVIEG